MILIQTNNPGLIFNQESVTVENKINVVQLDNAENPVAVNCDTIVTVPVATIVDIIGVALLTGPCVKSIDLQRGNYEIIITAHRSDD